MHLSKTLAQSLYRDKNSIGYKIRAKRTAPLKQLIEETYQKYSCVNIIDVGGDKVYWESVISADFLEKYKVHITVVNLPSQVVPHSQGRYTFVAADGCQLSSIQDNSFHLAHSNSVIEHVGDWSRMTQFAREISRVAPKYFVQTPNYWFPIEPHGLTPFFHWLPEPIRIWLVSHVQLGHWPKARDAKEAVRLVRGTRLLTKRQFQKLFPDSQIVTERFFSLPKSFVAVRT